MESGPHTFLKQDPVLAQLIDNHQPIELLPHPDPFERLIISVINQQLSIASARAIRDRLFERFEITPTSILNSNKDDLKSTGLSAQKVDYIFNIALAFKEGLCRNNAEHKFTIAVGTHVAIKQTFQFVSVYDLEEWAIIE